MLQAHHLLGETRKAQTFTPDIQVPIPNILVSPGPFRHAHQTYISMVIESQLTSCRSTSLNYSKLFLIEWGHIVSQSLHLISLSHCYTLPVVSNF